VDPSLVWNVDLPLSVLYVIALVWSVDLPLPVLYMRHVIHVSFVCFF